MCASDDKDGNQTLYIWRQGAESTDMCWEAASWNSWQTEH